MITQKVFKKIFVFSIVMSLFSTSLFQRSVAHAQSIGPQMTITWHTYGSYVPSFYIGKATPNEESQISATLAIITNGKFADLSNQTVYWYLNDTLVGGGLGKKHVVFSPFGTSPAYLTLRAEIPNYNGALLLHEVQIPLLGPKVVIEAPHPSGQFVGNKITLEGFPYFFYVSDLAALSYVWSINGQMPSTAENPQILQINIDPSTPSGTSFKVSLAITNPNDNILANDSTDVIYLKQL